MRPARLPATLPIAALACLAACTITALPVTEGRITTRAEFLATAGGKTISNDLATITIARNGRISGVSDNQAIAGTWEFRDGFVCRTITEPVIVPEDCQLWEVRGRTISITRDRGTGSQLIFALPKIV